MNTKTPFTYTVSYILDKEHFSETFDESLIKKPFIYEYGKSIFLFLLGLAIVLFTQVNDYLAWFVVVIALVDACSVYFKKPWWLARQMISQAANTELVLTIDENGVSTHSFLVDQKLTWHELSRIEQTPRGWLLYSASARYYISSRCLSQSAQTFIKQKADGL